MAQEGFSFFSQQYRSKRSSWCETMPIETLEPTKKRGSVDSSAYLPTDRSASASTGVTSGDISPRDVYSLGASDFVPGVHPPEPMEIQPLELVDLSTSKAGSKQVQIWISSGSAEQVRLILQTLTPHFLHLSQDPCGNYVCQRLLQYSTALDRLQLLNGLLGYLLELSMHPISTHVVQTLVSLINLPEELDLALAWLKDTVLTLARHEYGTHVVQKLVVTCKSRAIALVAQHFFTLATDKFGIGVVKRSISESATELDRTVLWQEMVRGCLVLSQDPFGNYAVQHMLDTWPLTGSPLYWTALQGRVTQLSLQKFSSNVVEKCVECGDAQTIAAIVGEISQTSRIALLLSNSYGIYVLRSVLRAVSGDAKVILKALVRATLPQVQQLTLRSRTEALLQE